MTLARRPGKTKRLAKNRPIRGRDYPGYIVSQGRFRYLYTDPSAKNLQEVETSQELEEDSDV